MSRKSTQIALGGVFSALCLVLMFMTGIFPFASYAIPAIAGAMLIPVVVENGAKTAVLVYISVSVLSVFIVPDREATMIFIVFFGYYPVLKGTLERIRIRVIEYILKLMLFNVTIVCGYLTVIFVLGMPDLLGEMEIFGKYTPAVFLGVGNVIFLLYDYLLTTYTTMYIKWFKPTFLRR